MSRKKQKLSYRILAESFGFYTPKEVAPGDWRTRSDDERFSCDYIIAGPSGVFSMSNVHDCKRKVFVFNYETEKIEYEILNSRIRCGCCGHEDDELDRITVRLSHDSARLVYNGIHRVTHAPEHEPGSKLKFSDMRDCRNVFAYALWRKVNMVNLRGLIVERTTNFQCHCDVCRLKLR